MRGGGGNNSISSFYSQEIGRRDFGGHYSLVFRHGLEEFGRPRI